jgi:hypothetical protein
MVPSMLLLANVVSLIHLILVMDNEWPSNDIATLLDSVSNT